jgi:superfamily II DNA or RNA helicase
MGWQDQFFGLGGLTYLALVPQILPILEDAGVYVELVDERTPHNFEFKLIDKDYLSDIKWPNTHPMAGQPIELRDYQIETINKFLEHPQCIQEIATGAGKTIITATLCKLVEDYGRTLTIVPNKSLVTQTEDDFITCNLDVGVYYGDRKELGRQNTIATWQSLNVLEKKSKDEHSEAFAEAIQEHQHSHSGRGAYGQGGCAEENADRTIRPLWHTLGIDRHSAQGRF